MLTLAQRFTRVRPHEAGLVFTLGFLLLVNSLALQMSELVAVSGFLSTVGANQLLLVWVIDMLLIIGAASAQSLIVDRFNRLRLLRAMIGIFAAIYILLRLMFLFDLPGWLTYSLLFLLSEQQWLFFPLIFWILANDIFDPAQCKRLFPFIGSFSFAGQILSFGIAGLTPLIFSRLGIPTAELLTLNVILYGIAFVLTNRLLNIKIRQTHLKPETVVETLTEGWEFVRDVLSFRYLMVGFFLAAAALTIIEYHFFAVSSSGISEPGAYQTFYSAIRLIETLLAITLQTVVIGRLLERFGLKNTFLVLPIATIIGAGGMVVLPGLALVATGWLGTRLALNTVDQSARKALQALVPEERRGRVSMFMDSYLLASGTILGCVITGGVLFAATAVPLPSATIYLSIALVMGVAAVAAILKMRTVYETSLFNWRLKRRQRNAGVLNKLDL